MKNIAILGSTGSIGTSTMDVISRFPDKFFISGLSTYSNIDLLLKQVKISRPKAVCVVDTQKAKEFKRRVRRVGKMKVYEGEEGLCKLVKDIPIDMLVIGIAGSFALLPILSALDRSERIERLVLANKEALVMAGDIIIKRARHKKIKILPVDSEHSAIFRCIESKKHAEIKKIYLTSFFYPQTP